MVSYGMELWLELAPSRAEWQYFDAISWHYITLYKAEKGIKIAHIETARPLTKELRQEMVSIITGAFRADIELEEEVKEEIIGGFVLRVEDKQLDASVKGKLGRIKKQLQK